MNSLIRPDWPAPPGIEAISSTRTGGVSEGAWASLNLGSKCGDVPSSVAENRKRLEALLPAPVNWLSQVHGTAVARHGESVHGLTEADAIVAHQPRQVCAVLSADCLPVLFSHREGSRVAAAHAGWRGLAAGVLSRTVEALDCEPAGLIAWLGPCIGSENYEVGDEVRSAFIEKDKEAGAAFRVSGNAWLANLAMLARLELHKAGIRNVYGGDFCTYSEPDRFFSYRRDGVTGRMATLIWMQ